MQRYLLIGFGGGIGSMLRYLIGIVVAERFGTRLPLGTFLINIVACFVIGLSLEAFNHHPGMSSAWRYLIAIGFIGGFSTFSGFEWEAWANLTTGAFCIGALYIVASVLVGLVAVALGTSAARALA